MIRRARLRPALFLALAASAACAPATLASRAWAPAAAPGAAAAPRTASDPHEGHGAAATWIGVPIDDQLAALRRATEPFRDLERAKAAKWDTAITPCWYHATQGAMGYHYAEVARLDGVVDSLRPEALMYEPQADGSFALVGVEYIVPIQHWDRADRPRLFGRDFDRNDALGLYVLHVWAWRDNPSGIFAGWNPAVTCAHAAAAEERG
ncbi:MAG: hypothetical protein K1X31_12595 [Gemmatimonadaceae bacterium]|nr:hypothetical protein [Gemmatimonadaceae bacterium]